MFFGLAALICSALVYAAPLEERAVTQLSSQQVAAFKPYAYYASAGYCAPSTIQAWNCGINCQSNSGFKWVAGGGDGGFIQYWYVGYDPALKTVIVSHQGTDASKIIPILTNANFDLEPPSSSLFPGVPSNVRVHQGFRDQHSYTAKTILDAVKSAMATYGATQVTLVGHSLGAALSLLDAVYLPLNLPKGTTFASYLYGMPRVGNPEFANWADTILTNVRRITSREDTVTIIPGRFLGYGHITGEIHISDSTGAWVSCSGQDNEAAECTIADVPNIFDGNTDDHRGPYDGVTISSSTCSQT